MEVYYALLRDGTAKSKADEVVAATEPQLIDFSFDDVKGAMALRLAWHRRQKHISYVDAVGYHLARQLGLRFLTGDAEFRDAPGVVFVGRTARGR